MGLLSDKQIRDTVEINPKFDGERAPGTISRGITSYGYDLTLGTKFHVFNNIYTTVIDPKNFDQRALKLIEGNTCIIPPNSYVLAETVEYVKIPKDCLGLVANKSTYVRCGISLPFTILEPEWEGIVTLEIANQAPLPAVIYAGEGIAQVLFLRGETQCLLTYAGKKGRYQNQQGVTLPFVT